MGNGKRQRHGGIALLKGIFDIGMTKNISRNFYHKEKSSILSGRGFFVSGKGNFAE
ncbi:MAG: hypothetical protein LBH19_15780 [Dysgonamonadaceae bacterium]|jgi:hypothetical protein|nr:hypothetical protein [Dysgonamonadaceae bacterium]